MTSESEKDKKFEEFRKAIEQAEPVRRKPKPKPSPKVSGIGNVVGDGNSVTNNISFFPKPPIRKVVVKTGDGVLDAKQKGELKELVDEIVELEQALRRTPRKHGAVWGALNRAMKVNSYSEIAAEAFPIAQRRLQRDAAILRAMKSAPKKAPDQAQKRIGAIQVRAKEFPDGDRRRRAYMMAKFGATSMTQLDPQQLEALYKHVMGWRRNRA